MSQPSHGAIRREGWPPVDGWLLVVGCGLFKHRKLIIIIRTPPQSPPRLAVYPVEKDR